MFVRRRVLPAHSGYILRHILLRGVLDLWHPGPLWSLCAQYPDWGSLWTYLGKHPHKVMLNHYHLMLMQNVQTRENVLSAELSLFANVEP